MVGKKGAEAPVKRKVVIPQMATACSTKTRMGLS